MVRTQEHGTETGQATVAVPDIRGSGRGGKREQGSSGQSARAAVCPGSPRGCGCWCGPPPAPLLFSTGSRLTFHRTPRWSAQPTAFFPLKLGAFPPSHSGRIEVQDQVGLCFRGMLPS